MKTTGGTTHHSLDCYWSIRKIIHSPMYRAELQGKLSKYNENKEDILTSNVFSFYMYTDHRVFLYPFLKKLVKIDVSQNEVENAQFLFWPRYSDNTEPDLVIIVGDYYLLFEAKYFSGFGTETEGKKAQLVREIEGGTFEAKNLGKQFLLIAVTAHYIFRREVIADIPDMYLSQFRWINWQSITGLLDQILENETRLSKYTLQFTEDLIQLLINKNLFCFEGYGHSAAVPLIARPSNRIFFAAKTAKYRGDFIGFRDALEETALLGPPTNQLFLRSNDGLFLRIDMEGQTVVSTTERLFFYG